MLLQMMALSNVHEVITGLPLAELQSCSRGTLSRSANTYATQS